MSTGRVRRAPRRSSELRNGFLLDEVEQANVHRDAVDVEQRRVVGIEQVEVGVLRDQTLEGIEREPGGGKIEAATAQFGGELFAPFAAEARGCMRTTPPRARNAEQQRAVRASNASRRRHLPRRTATEGGGREVTGDCGGMAAGAP